MACSAHRSLSGYDLLTTVTRAARPHERSCADVQFSYDEADRGATTLTGYLLSLHVHPDSGTGLQLEWTYDTRAFDPATVAELTEQFPFALIEVTSG